MGFEAGCASSGGDEELTSDSGDCGKEEQLCLGIPLSTGVDEELGSEVDCDRATDDGYTGLNSNCVGSESGENFQPYSQISGGT